MQEGSFWEGDQQPKIQTELNLYDWRTCREVSRYQLLLQPCMLNMNVEHYA